MDNKDEVKKNIEELKKDIEIKTESEKLDSYEKLGELYLSCGEYEEATEYFDFAIEKCKDNEKLNDLHNKKGFAHSKCKNYKNIEENYKIAEKHFMEAIRINDKDKIAYNNLGMLNYTLGNYDKALKNYEDAINLDSKFSYAYKNLGKVYVAMDEYKKAIDNFEKAIKKNVKESFEDRTNSGCNFNKSNAEFYYDMSNAKFYYAVYEGRRNGNIMVKDYKEAIDDYKEAVNLDNNIKNVDTELRFEILDRILKSERCVTELLKLLEVRQRILDILHMGKVKKKIKVTHYLSEKVIKSVLSEDKDSENSLRMNIAYLSNDPMEGKVLMDYLDREVNVERAKQLPFITCFSHELDSLNQFRLYGKKDREEATGVGIVFNEEFFNNKKVSPLCEIKIATDDYHYNLVGNGQSNDYKLSLYRCVYLGYIDENKDSELFCRMSNQSRWNEFLTKNGKDNQKLEKDNEKSEEDNDELKNEFKKLQNILKRIEDNDELKNEFKELRNILKKIEDNEKLKEEFMKLPKILKEIEDSLKDECKENRREVDDLISEILLPIQYLVKDPAFQEERECRIIVIAGEDDPRIKMDDNINRLYIDYEVPIKDHIDHLVVHEKQKQLVPYLKKLSGGKEVKISRNPFQH